MLCANWLNHTGRGWSGMPGQVRQNDTDCTLLQEELNAPILGHCGLILKSAPYNWVNFGPTAPNFDPLTAEIGSGVWGTPANFNGFRVLAALLHGI